VKLGEEAIGLASGGSGGLPRCETRSIACAAPVRRCPAKPDDAFVSCGDPADVAEFLLREELIEGYREEAR
jgi:hypothetical protein